MQLSVERQNMMRNLNVHEIMIGFLQKKLWMIEKIVEQDLKTEYKRQILLLLNDCYTFLIFFCKRNSDNQMILYKEAENIITYLRYDVGQLELLYTVKTA
jgi:hypothetical protein